MLKREIEDLIKKIDRVERGETDSSGLPENACFLDGETILCRERKNGDSRYPYSFDGYTLWAYASGYISIGESTFYVIPPADDGSEPKLGFFGGIFNGAEYSPVSITGVSKQPKESVKRYTVFTPKAFYYIARTPAADFALRGYVHTDKSIYFTTFAKNNTESEKQIYLASYFNCLLKYTPYEDFETKWFKECKLNENGYLFYSVVDLDRKTHLDHYAVIRRKIGVKNVTYLSQTTSKYDFTGGKSNSLNCSPALFAGRFEREKTACKFTETAASGDIVQLKLAGGDTARVDYALKVFCTQSEALSYEQNFLPEPAIVDRIVEEAAANNRKKFNSSRMLRMDFKGCEDTSLNADVFSKFTESVIRQVEYCALAKNSGVSLLGIRDLFQQLEACLIWNPKECRTKIIEALGFTNVNGRLPRQYSIPAKAGALPQMDLRPFIDQGVWVINTVYQYLAYTNDYSVLDEVCGYYQFLNGNNVALSDKKGTVLEHLFLIINYLTEHIDYEYTNCLRIMYGDWNDALDGLGVTTDEGKDYGSGVSVMATLQLYGNLAEMCEILTHVGGYEEKIREYRAFRDLLKRGLSEHAIVEKDGSRKILHGWGDKKSYRVGSFQDVDGRSRDGLVVNAYWVIGKAIEWDASLKKDILNSYKRLDSKYGLKTFEPCFERDAEGVGRIVNLPPGTAENAAVYIHAAMFGIWSLFMLNESKLAFEQLKKVLPLTHEKLSTTPFIMSNSYVYNEEYFMDGESMSDWFTGSANVLIKTLVRFVFGVQPNLDSVSIQPAKFIPFVGCDMNLVVRGCRITLRYCKRGDGMRKFIVNGVEMQSSNQNEFGLEKIVLNDTLLKNTDIAVQIIN